MGTDDWPWLAYAFSISAQSSPIPTTASATGETAFLVLQNVDAGGLGDSDSALFLSRGRKKVWDEGNDPFGDSRPGDVLVCSAAGSVRAVLL